MKRIAASLMLLGFVAAVAAAAGPVVGNVAPDFTGIDSNGESVTLSDLRGRVVVLEWTNHDCPYVRKHYGTGNMQSLQEAAADQGVIWVSIISSAPGTQGHVDGARANELTLKRDAHPTSVILDPEGTIGRLYEARTTPHMFVIDRQGNLIYAGGIDDKPSSRASTVQGARNYVREALDATLSGKPVAVTTSRPYGCSVKYR